MLVVVVLLFEGRTLLHRVVEGVQLCVGLLDLRGAERQVGDYRDIVLLDTVVELTQPGLLKLYHFPLAVLARQWAQTGRSNFL